MESKSISRNMKIILLLSLLLSLLVMVASFSGVFIKETYSKEVRYFAVQGIGQDFVNLVIVSPALIISSFLFYKMNKAAMFIWSGIILYLIYSYTIYCFSMHFNFLFLIYCGVFGLSFYLFGYYFITQLKKENNFVLNNSLIKITSSFFILLSSLFYFMWLSEVIPALIKNEIPKSVLENGVATNAVHVLDISIFLPGLVITAFMLKKKKLAGFILTPAFLTFSLFMYIAIIGMMITLNINGFETELSVVLIFSIITFFCLLLLLIFLKSMKKDFGN
ncbi:MAG: hypothetical protein WHS65_10235 [Melioribacteraceae bacterium]